MDPDVVRRASWRTDLIARDAIAEFIVSLGAAAPRECVSDRAPSANPFHHSPISSHRDSHWPPVVAATQIKARMPVRFRTKGCILPSPSMCAAKSNRIIPVAAIDFHFPLGCTNEARIFTAFPNDGVRH
jgi:hypothetical protein